MVSIVVLALSMGCAINRLWAPSQEQILERILPSSIQVVVEREGSRFRSGSGVAIAARQSAGGTDCFLLTSGHTFANLSDNDRVFVLFGRSHGPGTKAAATVLALGDTREADLALLRAQSSECFPAEFGEPPRLGVPIWVLAYPWGRNMTLAGGIVSQVNGDQLGDPETAPRLIVDASVSYGASGGGVYDERTGRLVGLIEGYRTARVSFNGDAQYIDVPVPGETYVVPLAAIRRFLVQADRKDLLGALSAIANPQP